MSGIYVVESNLEVHPKCPHGPTVLFSRTVNAEGDRRQFYACSACRDRKGCQFFLWQDQEVKSGQAKSQAHHKQTALLLKDSDHRKLFVQFQKILSQPPEKRIYCYSCSEFVPEKFSNKHQSHLLKLNISDHHLRHPSEFLKPLDDVKKEAQYLFAKSSIKTIVDILDELKFRNILCIGAPRIHEYIQNNRPDLTSLLLDIDKRYMQFFGPLQFCWYNCFNDHLFLKSSKSVLNNFLKSDSGKGLALVTDPPFGGRVELLARTITRITANCQRLNGLTEEMPVMWIFPYFMEPQIRNSLPNYHMLDYKVDYDNHPLFQDGPKGRKYGSPVRIFTNVDRSKITLPKDEGYRLCKVCNRWVSVENNHCKLCKDCTSKDGRTYVHCNVCKRCVKPSWEHCDQCQRCVQPQHKCGKILEFNQECFHCKQTGHKKRDCPKVDQEALKNKRVAKVDKARKNKKFKNKSVI